jgi:hypothetical protein
MARLSTLFRIGVLATLSACASGHANANVQRSVGMGSAPDILERSQRVLNIFQYEIDREESSALLITVQTRWRRRSPFDDEKSAGFNQAENRVTVTGRARTDSDVGGSVYAVSMLVENRVRLSDSEQWIEAPPTPMYRAYADSLTKHLQRELTLGVGVRR